MLGKIRLSLLSLLNGLSCFVVSDRLAVRGSDMAAVVRPSYTPIAFGVSVYIGAIPS